MWKPRTAILGLATALLTGLTTSPSDASQVIENTSQICARAVRAEERRGGIPAHLLHAISQAESGRWNKEKKANIAWPWTVTSGGKGRFFDTKAEAVAEVEILRTRGVENIDVGCMQINLFYHDEAFETIEQAFDPAANAAYGAQYLKAMFRKTGNWLRAAAAYHSVTPGPNNRYRAKVARLWNVARGIPEKPVVTAAATPAPTASNVPAARQLKNDIDHDRTHQLNSAFRARRAARRTEATADRNAAFAFRRHAQLDAWRESQAGGLDLVHLANMRRAEQAQRRKRAYARAGNAERPEVFAERRRQQLDDWRAKRIIPFPTATTAP